jgi:hypothetical protein
MSFPKQAELLSHFPRFAWRLICPIEKPVTPIQQSLSQATQSLILEFLKPACSIHLLSLEEFHHQASLTQKGI